MEKFTIEQREDFFKEYTIEQQKQALDITLEKIKFLESIYQTWWENYFYDEIFRDSAYNTRQRLCQKSSALYDLIRKS